MQLDTEVLVNRKSAGNPAQSTMERRKLVDKVEEMYFDIDFNALSLYYEYGVVQGRPTRRSRATGRSRTGYQSPAR